MVKVAKVVGIYFLLSLIPPAGSAIAETTGIVAGKAVISADKATLGALSAARRKVAGKEMESVNRRVLSRSSNFSTQNEQAVVTAKAKPKTAKVIFALICAALLSVLIFSLTSASYYSTRFCSVCSYSGEMSPVTLSKKPFFNKILLLVVKVVPEVLYFYAEKGRFKCPKCHRVNTHISLKKNPQELERSRSGKNSKRRRLRKKQREE